MNHYDLIVVGGGPAGMTAALYALRNGKTVLLLEKNAFGGQMNFSPRIENYPGIPSVSGLELADLMMRQILALGAEAELENVVRIEQQGADKAVFTEEGSIYRAPCVVLATGAKHRHLGLDGEEELIGSGISFCALCDGDFFSGQEVAVAGGGNSALMEALLLADVCARVTIVQDLDHLTGETGMQKALRARENVRILTGQRIVSLESREGQLTGLTLHSAQGETHLPVSGLFVAIGLEPDNAPFAGLAALDASGCLIAGEDCKTSCSGVFAAGDCRTKAVRQISTAVADGAVAALAACRLQDA